ncbi:hypothetical protein BV372_15895 [Nostoc sp. T09]|uniref:hypothetical protein n=1 Tax=Nostoc sp. T09 TaxID=1932621 RepID=UPI000A36B9AA|nr:hypothetical protein [Nostoc sp. T09]OUL33607.1 hypothetical protein BV372_15895 [Nostoc sp. T09]
MSKEQHLQLAENNTELAVISAYELKESELEAISGGASTQVCTTTYRLNGQPKMTTCTTTTTN